MTYIDNNTLGSPQHILDARQELLINRAIYGISAYETVDPLAAHIAEQHYMDKSTGTVREEVSLWISGTIQYNKVEGPAYDGYRLKPLHSDRPIEYIEAKPRTLKYGEGGINDHTMTRHERFIKDGLIMQGSAFFYGTLGFIFEFPYEDIKDHMKAQILRAKGRCVGHYSFPHWYDSRVKLIYLNKEIIALNRESITGGKFKNPKKPVLFHWLMDHDNILFDK